MDITRSGSQPSGKGPTESFTGSVRIDPLFQAPDPARVAGASVTFEPGARTAWLTDRPLDSDYLFTRFDGRGEGSHVRLTDQPLSAFSVRTIVKQAALQAYVP